ncbi:MAG: AAA family ATPase [Chloroflexota bacterium]
MDRPLVSPVTIGRGSYLHALEMALAEAVTGRGGAILVSGEAGVGKSRLLGEGEARAARMGMMIVRGNCWENDRALPYAPLLDLLRSLLFSQSFVDRETHWQPYAPELIKLLPDLASFFPGLMPSPQLEPEQEKRRLFDAICGLLSDLAAAQPLMVAIEDVHWADDVSLEFLLYAARQAQKKGTFFVITYREGDDVARLSRWLAALDRERLVVEMRLGRLTREDVNLMLQAIFELGRPVHGPFLDAIYLLTEGNAFFIEEVLKSLVQSGGIYLEGGVWERKPVEELSIPRSVQDAVARRVEGLHGEARQTLALAAVIGRRFDFPLLQALTGRDESLLLGDIKALIAAQLVVEVSEDLFSFRHALTQRAIYSGLLARERKGIHSAIARKIEAVYESSLDAHVGDLAHHSYEAGLWAEAFDYSRRAGESAQRLYAPRAAIEHYVRALDAAAKMHAEMPFDLYLMRGSQYEILGDFENAKEDYERALSIARKGEDKKGEWRALMELGKLWAGRDYNESGSHFREALALARVLGEPALMAHSLNRVGNWSLNVEQFDELEDKHEEALEIFRQLNNKQGEIETLDLLGMSWLVRGDMYASASYYRRALPLLIEADDKQGVASVLATLPLAIAYTYQTDSIVVAPEEQHEEWTLGIQARDVAREIGLRSGEAFALAMLALVYGMRGEYDNALASARTALQIAEDIGHSQWAAASLVQVGSILCDILAYEQARPTLERAVQLARETGSQHWLRLAGGALAECAIAQGDCRYAREVLDSVLSGESRLQTMGQRRIGLVRVLLALAEGKREDALAGIQRLFASAHGLEDERDPWAAIPRVAMLRGEALTMNGRYEQAEEALAAAQRGAEQLQTRSLLWKIALRKGKLYTAMGRPADASSAYAEGRRLLERLSASIPDEVLRVGFLDRAGAMFPETVAPTKRDTGGRAARPGGLTARELEVVKLVAVGMTNREIAEQLVLGERTVETHVSNALSKLGFTSRSQLAAWLVGEAGT